jgi:hypothetical protein
MKPINNQTQSNLSHRENGGTTFMALFMLALILFIGATVLLNVTRLYNGSEKVEGWQEALNAAEAGADLGLANLRWMVVTSPSPVPSPAFNPSPSPSPSPAIAWTKTTTTDPVTHLVTNTTYTCTMPYTTQAGEGTDKTWAVVTVDSPIGDNTTSPPSGLTYSGNQWWRIRSTGHAQIPGLKQAAIDILSDPNARHSNSLRKFNLVFDRTSGATVSAPEATRTIEVLVQPKTSWLPGLLALTDLTISPSKPELIDSYDPTDPTKSTNGLYDPAKRQANGNIGVGGTRNGTVITSSSGDLTVTSGEKIYGNASTNGGSFTDPNNTIQSPGTINNSINVNVPIIPIPTWGTSGQPSINGAVTNVSGPTTITANSNSALNYYKISGITGPLTIAGTGTVNIWLTGDVTTQGAITINVGAAVKIYFTGDTFHPGLSGSNVGAINNLNKDPQDFQLYGCGTLAGSGPGIDLHVGGAGVQNFYGTVYAPYRLINLKYDGSTAFDTSSGHYGSFVGDTINLKSSVHYDEALNGVGDSVIDYDRASYVEDPR